MYTKIMLAFDGSDASKRALDYIRTTVPVHSDTQLDIVAVSTYTIPNMPPNIGWYGIGTDFQAIDPQTIVKIRDEQLQREQEEALEDLKEHLQGMPCKYEVKAVPQGLSIADTILDYAEDNDVDLVVMGSRGLGAIRGALGSVSYAVLRGCPKPVLIIK